MSSSSTTAATPAKRGNAAAPSSSSSNGVAAAAGASRPVARREEATAEEDGPTFDEPLRLLSAPQGAERTTKFSGVMKYFLLFLICLLSFAIRIFSVTKYESVIAEYDPQFQFRFTKVLSSEGFFAFLNWQDDRSWWPLGRLIGGTSYPGLLMTAAGIRGFLEWSLSITLNVRNACVFTAPVFAGFTAIAAYLLTSTVMGGRSSTGLIAAALVGTVPSYISRSVAGSFDNEGVAIFALVFTFYLWVKAVMTGRLLWSMASALAFFFMVASWGGYVFLQNAIPIYAALLILSGRYSSRLYVAYSTFYIVGSLLAMQVPFVGFNVVKQAEAAASHGVFLMVQLTALHSFLSKNIPAATIRRLLGAAIIFVIIGAAALLIAMQLLGMTQWTGRSLTLLDPTYAKKFIPIIASVSEHQPTAWTSFFFDLHVAVPLAPVGLFFLFSGLKTVSAEEGDARIFLIVYGTISWYFAGVMVRLMLTLAPAACMLAAIGFSGLINTFSAHLKLALSSSVTSSSASSSKKEPVPAVVSIMVLLGTGFMLLFYALHAAYVSSEAYSSPSIILSSRRQDGSRAIFDDFREAYYWLRQNTADDAKISSWWDYGYQISVMANRTVFVDNNTWNNTHIATVGRSMVSNEEDAYPILHSLEADYILILFGGLTGYQSDDINKMLWMVRIGGGVFPHIKESDYFADGQYRMDKGGSPTMLNCLMYKMSYYRFDEMQSGYGRPMGFDQARNTEAGHKGIKFSHLEEVFTSEHWLVRIYKVHKPPNRDGQFFNAIDSSKDQYGRQRDSAALPSSGVRSRKRQPLWPEPGSTRLDDGKAKVTGGGSPAVKWVGCYKFEDSFGPDRKYEGGAAGASISVARSAAATHGKRYLAISRVGGDGHSFGFDRLPSHGPDGGNSPGCFRPCGDDQEYSCGCADAACENEEIDPGHDNVRRWAVYEILPEGTPGISPKAAMGGKGSSGGGSKSKNAGKR